MRKPLALALAGLALAMPACGGDDEETTTETTTATAATGSTGATGPEGKERAKAQGSSAPAASPQHEITAAVEAVVGGGQPDATCGELVTERYVSAAYGDAQGCRAAVSRQGSFEVEVMDVDAGAAKATATAVPAGGPNEGENLSVELVDEGGEWKVDFARSDAPPGP